MTVTYNALVQTDVNGILEKYDAISAKLADEFWAELNLKIAATAKNPLRSHSLGPDLRRVNLPNFPYHFVFRVFPDRIRVIVVRHDKRHPRLGLRRR
jgi:plasmid stabilization system protein ParE